MKARDTPNRKPSDPVDVLWDHGDRIDTLERRKRSDRQFLREHIFTSLDPYSPPPI